MCPPSNGLYRELTSIHDNEIQSPTDEANFLRNSDRSFPGPSVQAHDLWLAAVDHTDRKGRVVVVLATLGYFDMLSNFLQSVSMTTSAREADQNLPILVLTDSTRVAELASRFRAGYYFIPSAGYHGLVSSDVGLEPGNARTAEDDIGSDSDGDRSMKTFGTLSYQQLILGRTECVRDVLLLGFSPIIADIDTVWFRDALQVLDAEIERYQNASFARDYDVVVTDDKGEVCGCFLSLASTPAARHFWHEVLVRHRELVSTAATSVINQERNRTGADGGALEKFSDSEQKILTDLIIFKQYSRLSQLRVFKLSARLFPSGFDFFNVHGGIARPGLGYPNASTLRNGRLFRSCPANEAKDNEPAGSLQCDLVPAVIHNNFVIGKHVKKIRFERQGLWMPFPPLHTVLQDHLGPEVYSQLDHAAMIMQYDPMLPWRGVADTVERTLIPNLNFVVPMHDQETEKFTMVQVQSKIFVVFFMATRLLMLSC
jgi:hypothetical protein